MTTDTKPRDAGEVMLDILALADTMHLPYVPVADMLTAWRREIESAMVERIAEWAEEQGGWKSGDAIRARFGRGGQ